MEELNQILLFTEQRLREAINEELASQIKSLEERLTKSNTILTRDEVAERLKVSPNTISKYVDDGILINRGVGRKILIAESDLDGINSRKKRGGYFNWN
jgi:excisionase family DNA binding protein